MLRNMAKEPVGSAMATLCLVSTLAIAQSQSSAPPVPQGQNPNVQQEQKQYPAQPMTPQTGNTTPQQGHRQQGATESQMQKGSESLRIRLTCTRDDGKGNCTAATGKDGKEFVVNGEGLKSGATMTCIDRGTVVDCEPAS